ncbi:valine--tRNA ligase [bacterium (Candidatus Howlettbacteria) CG_4_9_14_3_um_filter_37_10]|nr:MAG: valine--tRNA ligase [bacterium (Candidatus Howlettbacteria) CG23_combo_of_CG06-09_8_20_14_all_37_9]PJB06071.1 MAG: valine--tRNA ligase [bacterium (Candidatus Howlettbacteria) CG_4_9_14_3_um_filter_37_10]
MSELEKRFNLNRETDIYQKWEKGGYFKPEINNDKDKGEYCIIMPPPNANGNLHLGHALMVAVEDILIRYNRMLGKKTLWLPGADHAGFETWVVYEKVLQKQGKSKFDFERDDIYKQIWDFTQNNKEVMVSQLKALGSSCDWSREKFTLDKDIIKTVYKIFKKMHKEGLIYRGNRIVNWDPYHQTGFSDLEINHVERKTNLTYIKYQIKGREDFITVATTRPETMLGDTAVAVNPNDARYKNLIGEIAILPILNREIPIVADEAVEMGFGSGAVKITPAHDNLDFEIGERHNLPAIQVIDKFAKMTAEAGNEFEGLKVKEARTKVLEKLEELKQIERVEEITHNASVCYKCGRDIEPLITDQWFIKVDDLAKNAMEAVENGDIKFVTKRYEKIFFNWMENLKDWNISRQIVWGIRIPAWFCECGEIIVTDGKVPEKCPKCSLTKLTQDPDTFDTWFSSAQWPYATLGYPNGKDYLEFYPADVMETAWDILIFWVARMIMMGLYTTEREPFKTVYIHGLIRDKKGAKMSKSKGNVVNPMDLIDKYGSDALRLSLIMGNAPGNDLNFMEEKVIGSRNFVTKLWNIARFIQMNTTEAQIVSHETFTLADNWINNELNLTLKNVTKNIDSNNLNLAIEELYDFVWSKFAAIYIESAKFYLNNEISKDSVTFTLRSTFKHILKALHPFMPFVTEEIWENLELSDKMLIVEDWPTDLQIEVSDENVKKFEAVIAIISEIRNKNLVPEDTYTIENDDFSDEEINLIKFQTKIKEIKQ